MSKHEHGIWSALGLMSGTSLDGIDIALIETDGNAYVKSIKSTTYAYSDDLRAQLRKGLDDASTLTNRTERPGRLKLLEQYLTDLHAEAVGLFLVDYQIPPDSIDLIGFHGQTVLHRPDVGLTVQLGDGPRLAELTGYPVIYDMRADDVAAGGEGAPLVPAYHKALVTEDTARPIAVVNIGGVANVTWVGPDGELIAFDTGPGNALINDWLSTRRGEPFDRNGALAATGSVNGQALTRYIADPYIAKPAPKSLDRNTFSLEAIEELSDADGAATLTALTAECIAASVKHMPAPPKKWIICGGGRHNDQLMKLIRERTDGEVVSAEDLEWNGDAIEAEAWGYLAVRAALKQPITFPGTTGVKEPKTGGKIARPPSATLRA